MELVFRQRLDRVDKKGRSPVFGDLHWAGGHRWKIPTGISVVPAHFQPTKTKRIHTGADRAAQHNLTLDRLQTAVGAVFQRAQLDSRDESSVTQDELAAALREAGARSGRAQPAAKAVALPTTLTATSDWQQFNERWQRENANLITVDSSRAYNQVVNKLTEFDADLRLATLTRERLAQYVGWLHSQGKRDSTVQRHYKFLRECCRLAEKVLPKWLTLPNARYGRALALKKAEVLALVNVDFTGYPDLAEERDAFLLQLFLLLRDVDLRALRRHHVSDHALPTYGEVPCVELYQEKTGEPVRIPLPPPARAIWSRYDGPPPLPVQQERNRRLKMVGRMAGLTREVVLHSFSGKKHNEEIKPVYKAITTHTARHTGAGLVLLGSDGDQTLKEIALGHVSESVYGYDTLERYGPLLLQAWAEVL